MSQIEGPAVGDQAPDFVLRRFFDDTVALTEMRGRGPVVVAFYVFDFGNL